MDAIKVVAQNLSLSYFKKGAIKQVQDLYNSFNFIHGTCNLYWDSETKKKRPYKRTMPTTEQKK